MRRVMVCSLAIAALVAVGSPAIGANLVTNGDFSAGLTDWTQWNSPWGGPFTVEVDGLGELHLGAGSGSFGLVQELATVPGQAYTITVDWSGVGTQHWVEVLLINDDGRPVYDQLDAPDDDSVISKIAGDFGSGVMNGGVAGGGPGQLVPAAVPQFWFPNGLLTNTVVASGAKMYVGLKAGAGAGVEAWFDNVVVTPEPATLLLLTVPALLIGRRRA